MSGMREERPVLPLWGPEWARRRSWIWSVAVGVIQGWVITGLVRYAGDANARVSWIVGVLGGVAFAITSRVFITRSRRMSKIWRNPMFDVRQWPAWIAWSGPFLVVAILLSTIVDRTARWDGWKIAWAVALVVSLGMFDFLQYQWIRRIQSDPVIMSYGRTSYYTHPPVPPPPSDKPPVLPGSGQP